LDEGVVMNPTRAEPPPSGDQTRLSEPAAAVMHATVADFSGPGSGAPDAGLAETRGAEDRSVWRPGDVLLGLYEVKCVLGQGGMGTVYKVHHRGWNLDLAVKTPRPDVLAQAGAENFEREAENWVNLGLYPHV